MTWYLKNAGVEDITVLEKAADVGGTWRDNSYPGLACDVPSRFYQFRFAPNPDWSHLFSPGPEILDYFRKVADDHDLRRHIVFGVEATDLTWDTGVWRVATNDGNVREADFVVTATGILHHPNIPDLPGMSDFQGPIFHSARWDHSVPIEGARIGVVGSGSTGVQIVSALGGNADQVVLFQRSPHWVVPVPNPGYPSLTRAAHRLLPVLDQLAYLGYRTAFERVSVALVQPGVRRTVVTRATKAGLRAVKDRKLRAAITPDFEPMCRRLIFSPDFYRAVQRADVRVVTTPIDRFVADGIATDGEQVKLDAVVLATGFDSHAFMRPTQVSGRDGLTIDQAWSDGPFAYHGVALPGFPNLFMAMGPHSPVGNYSLTAIAEAQAQHITAWISRWADDEFDTIEPRYEATRAHNAEMKAALPGTVWSTGCTSWYLGKDGTPELWPWSPEKYRHVLARPRREDWETHKLLTATTTRARVKSTPTPKMMEK
ncbi:NAD(P)/FAD-dependent oxidoreductase [Nocardioides sp. LML1-1-1.1]